MAPRRKRASILDPYRAYLTQRWQEGCHNGAALFREWQQQGYAGGRSIIANAVRAWRAGTRGTNREAIAAVVERSGTRCTSPRPVRWWVVRKVDALDREDQHALAGLLAAHDEADMVYELAQRFGVIVRERRQSDLADWLAAARCGPRERRSFADGIERDRAAVDAALIEPWSQGQTEGPINKLKLIKRKMFGRAKLDLLRRRVLEAA
jgi:transposase